MDMLITASARTPAGRQPPGSAADSQNHREVATQHEARIYKYTMTKAGGKSSVVVASYLKQPTQLLKRRKAIHFGPRPKAAFAGLTVERALLSRHQLQAPWACWDRLPAYIVYRISCRAALYVAARLVSLPNQQPRRPHSFRAAIAPSAIKSAARPRHAPSRSFFDVQVECDPASPRSLLPRLSPLSGVP